MNYKDFLNISNDFIYLQMEENNETDDRMNQTYQENNEAFK